MLVVCVCARVLFALTPPRSLNSPQEPNNWGDAGPLTGNEDCASRGSDGKHYDLPCDSSEMCLCESDEQPAAACE